MTRPLLVIFLTIFVNLVGFGIIIPLLPFYAETFGASPLVVGLLFAVFSLCQLVAAPILGDLSDRYGRRPILILSLIGTVVSFVMLALAQSLTMLFIARIVDGLSGGNISTARAYVADVTEPKDRSRAFGLIGAAFGLGFILGPGISALLAPISYTAPIWAAAGITLVATAMAFFWLPETVHRTHAGTGMPFRNVLVMMGRPVLRRVLLMDFAYWFAFAIFQTTFALFAAARFGFDAARTAFFFAAFAVLGAVVQGVFIRTDRPATRRQEDVHARPGLRRDRPRGGDADAHRRVLRHLAGPAGARHRLRSSDDVQHDQPGGAGRGTGTRPGRGQRRGEPRANHRAGVGECVAAALRGSVALHCRRRLSHHDALLERRPSSGGDVTDQEKQKVEDLISRLELQVGQIFPRDGGNASLLAGMIQTLNGLRSVLGLVRPH